VRRPGTMRSTRPSVVRSALRRDPCVVDEAVEQTVELAALGGVEASDDLGRCGARSRPSRVARRARPSP
jgi:hypothetical protein